MLIILNGVPNAGKSTVSKLLVHSLPNTVHLEVDKLTDMVPWMPLSDLIGLAMENVITILPNFFQRGLNVIVDYPLDKYWHGYICEAARKFNVGIVTFTLKPRLEMVCQSRGERSISKSLSHRIRELYETDMNDPSLGIFIDNSEQTPEETAREIQSHLH